MSDKPRPRWFTGTSEGHSQWYIERFRAMAREGADLDGEARMIDAMVPRGARVLDAGCGSGRVSGALSARGLDVVGVDVDPELVAAAEADYPGPEYVVADLAELDLPSRGIAGGFDAAVMAGNVICFVAPRSEPDVLSAVGRHLADDGRLVVGFGMGRTLTVPEFDEHVAAAGLVLDQRYSTWDLRPWAPEDDFVVSVLRRS